MNKKGQALITFVLILPLIIFFLAFFIDSARSMLEKNKIDGIIDSNMQIILEKNIRDEKKIINIIKENDNSLDVNAHINEDKIEIYVNKDSKNIFGNIFKLDLYKLEFNYCGNYVNKKIDKKCGGI